MSILDETLAHNFDDKSGLVVTNRMKSHWMTTSKWALFFAILGFIGMGLSLLSVGSMATTLEMMRMMGGDNPIFAIYGMLLPFLTVITVITAAVMFFVHFFHLRFATQIQRAVNFTDQAAFLSAWKNLRNHFRILGILVCVALVFYGIMLIFVATKVASAGSSFPME